MKAADIRAHLSLYSISAKRSTTIRHAFASAIAPVERYDEQRVRDALLFLGQKDLLALTCIYCDKPATTWDHIEALVSKKRPSGFGHTLGNLVPACRDCNSERGNKPWAAWMLGRGGSADRVALVRAYHDRFVADGPLISHQKLTAGQKERMREIENQITELMAEADEILAGARRGSGPTVGKPGSPGADIGANAE